MKAGLLIIYFLSFILCSCGSDDFLDGYDKRELFAPPSKEELDAIKSDWSLRNLAPNDVQVEQTIALNEEGVVLKMVSYRVQSYKQYGALLIPGSGDNLPVWVYIGGFGKDISMNSVRIAIDSDHVPSSILAIPALRGQSLKIMINEVEYTTPLSEGVHCDAFDGATDDAIALLNIVENIENRANVQRVSVRGGSRGGTVALLMAERDTRVKIAISVSGPTNMLELTSTNENDPTYQCQFLQSLIDKVSTITETRQKMIASSPVYFADLLPKTQTHFAAEDRIVPVEQGYELNAKMLELGLEDSFEMYIYENRDHSNIATDNEDLTERINALLDQL